MPDLYLTDVRTGEQQVAFDRFLQQFATTIHLNIL
jgi:hypothetical protein